MNGAPPKPLGENSFAMTPESIEAVRQHLENEDFTSAVKLILKEIEDLGDQPMMNQRFVSDILSLQQRLTELEQTVKRLR